MGEKTEEATPKKLEDARKKGQVAKAQDLPSAITFIVSVSVTLGLIGFLFQQIGGFLQSTFAAAVESSDPDTMIRLIGSSFLEGLYVMFISSIPILGIVAAIGVIVTFLVVGPVFTFEVFKLDINKFNPVENLKQKFKMKTLIELLKSIFKISLACYIVYDVMMKSIPVLIKTVDLPILNALLIFNYFLIEVVAKIGFLYLVIAVLDFFYQKHTFSKEMRMEKFEVKQEYKNTEGDPQIKGKRRQIAQEIAYQDGPAGSVKQSKAVVTNPTHIAIAIGYEKGKDPAPYVLYKATGNMAKQTIKLAEKYDIPVMRNVDLAHTLWDRTNVNSYVPEETYQALAEILMWVESLQQGGETIKKEDL